MGELYSDQHNASSLGIQATCQLGNVLFGCFRMDNFCNKTNIMQMKEALQTGVAVAEFRRTSAVLLGTQKAAVFNLQSKVGKTATVAFETASGERNAEAGKIKQKFNKTTTTGAVES